MVGSLLGLVSGYVLTSDMSWFQVSVSVCVNHKRATETTYLCFPPHCICRVGCCCLSKSLTVTVLYPSESVSTLETLLYSLYKCTVCKRSLNRKQTGEVLHMSVWLFNSKVELVLPESIGRQSWVSCRRKNRMTQNQQELQAWISDIWRKMTFHPLCVEIMRPIWCW